MISSTDYPSDERTVPSGALECNARQQRVVLPDTMVVYWLADSNESSNGSAASKLTTSSPEGRCYRAGKKWRRVLPSLTLTARPDDICLWVLGPFKAETAGRLIPSQ